MRGLGSWRSRELQFLPGPAEVKAALGQTFHHHSSRPDKRVMSDRNISKDTRSTSNHDIVVDDDRVIRLLVGARSGRDRVVMDQVNVVPDTHPVANVNAV